MQCSLAVLFLTMDQVAVRIAVIVSSAELLIMLILPAFPHADSVTLAVLDVALLVLFSTSPIYIWVVAPCLDSRDKALIQANLLAATDPLTQLANRRQISGQLEKALDGGVRHKVPGALLLVDLDGFKLVNDAHGHDAGDAVLVEVAQRLRSITRAEDVVGRIGGDEFLVLIGRLDADERIMRDKVLRIAEKLITNLTVPVDFNGRTLHVGASIGIRLLGCDELDARTAIREADVAMYRAKQAGKGRVVVFEKSRAQPWG